MDYIKSVYLEIKHANAVYEEIATLYSGIYTIP